MDLPPVFLNHGTFPCTPYLVNSCEGPGGDVPFHLETPVSDTLVVGRVTCKQTQASGSRRHLRDFPTPSLPHNPSFLLRNTQCKVCGGKGKYVIPDTP